MSSPDIDIGALARLARLRLSDTEQQQMQSECGQILEAFAKLQAIDTSQTPPAYSPFSPSAPLRKDKANPSELAQDLRSCAPGGTDSAGLLRVPKV